MQSEVNRIPAWERQALGFLVRKFFAEDRTGKAWAPPAHLPHRRVTFEGNTGARIAGVWYPHDDPRGAVVLAHPDKRYGKHWFVRDGWVDWLHAHGYEVLTFDFPGYGESDGPARYYHEDVIAAAHFARRWAGGLPVHVVGVSMGAFAAANAAPHLPFVHSLTLESPYPTIRAWYGARSLPGRVVSALNRAFPRTERALRADANIARAAVKRVLVIAADADEVTPVPLTDAVARAAPAERTRVLHVPGARHLAPFSVSPAYRRALLDVLDPAREW